MNLQCSFETPVARAGLDDYLRRILIDARVFDGEGEGWYAVARLAVDQVLWADARADGESPFEVCDADSQELHHVHHVLTRGRDDFRPDLLIDGDETDTVLVL